MNQCFDHCSHRYCATNATTADSNRLDGHCLDSVTVAKVVVVEVDD